MTPVTDRTLALLVLFWVALIAGYVASFQWVGK
jgi:hypothetical protein